MPLHVLCVALCSAGVGQIDHRHLEKADGEIGMLVVKIGGPAYRIGMGGGAASSVPSGSNKADLDFNAVQRGDAEMSQKLWRVVRSCVELGGNNPLVQIHDQGAGGNCNVVKEIIYPLGGEIDVRAVKVRHGSGRCGVAVAHPCFTALCEPMLWHPAMLFQLDLSLCYVV